MQTKVDMERVLLLLNVGEKLAMDPNLGALRDAVSLELASLNSSTKDEVAEKRGAVEEPVVVDGVGTSTGIAPAVVADPGESLPQGRTAGAPVEQASESGTGVPVEDDRAVGGQPTRFEDQPEKDRVTSTPVVDQGRSTGTPPKNEPADTEVRRRI